MQWFDGDSASCPRIVRFLGMHAVLGAVCGLVLAFCLIATNFAGLADLLSESDTVVLGTAMLAASFALTFGAAAMGTAVMLLPRDE